LQTWWFDQFMGLAPLLLLPFALLAGCFRAWALSAISLFLLLLALADRGGLLLPLADCAPGFGLFRKAYRYAAPIAFLLGPVAAKGLSVFSAMMHGHGRGPLLRRLPGPWLGPAAGAMVALMALVLWVRSPEIPASPAGDFTQAEVQEALAEQRLLPLLLGLPAVLLCLPLLFRKRRTLAVFACSGLVVGTTAVHLYCGGQDKLAILEHLRTGGEKSLLSWARGTERKFRLWQGSPQRTGLASRHSRRLASGYPHPMGLKRHSDFIAWAEKVPSRLGLFNVRYLETGEDISRHATKVGRTRWVREEAVPAVAFYPGIRIAANAGEALTLWERAQSEGLAVVELADWTRNLDDLVERKGERVTGKIVELAANRVRATITAPTYGIVVVNEVYHKWWRAELDGSPVPMARVNYLLRGLKVEAGKHTIDFVYDPPGYSLLLALCLVAVVILAWSGLVAIWNRCAAEDSPGV
jgi:hypothetical protein